MKVYLVGGAVRDRMLQLPVHERDWVVVGSTPEALLELGYKPVGKDFPVFLHPETKEEYALARTERKVALGYKGFVFHASPEVTLEEDLKRRDLTINAMAEDEQGRLIDPFNGARDLAQRCLRHVSPAFEEDPVRILRIARFAARYGTFTIAEETMALMQNMVHRHEVDALVAERVFQELSRALSESSPKRFFETLNQSGAFSVLFPEVDCLQAIKILEVAKSKTEDPMIRFALSFFTVSDLAVFCKKWRVPSEWADFLRLLKENLSFFDEVSLENPELILSMLQKTDAYRRFDRFEKWLLACEIQSNVKNKSAIKKTLERAAEATKNISLGSEEYAKLSGQQIHEMLFKKRLQFLEQMR